MTEDTTKFGVSRRTLAKGAAWSVPAVAVAAGAPAFAVSGVGQVACGCKDPGKPWQYRMRFCFKNTTTATITITVTSFKVNTDTLINLTTEGSNTNSFTVSSGATVCKIISGNNTKSGNGMGRVDFTYTIGTSSTVYSGYVQGATNDLPPCHDGLRLTQSCGDVIIGPPTTGDTGNQTTSAEAKVEEPKVEETKVEKASDPVEETKVEKASDPVEETKVEETTAPAEETQEPVDAETTN